MSSATRRSIADRALVRAFVARFFENEISSSSLDLTRSFFGLVAVLGMPGALFPIFMMVGWDTVGRFQGVEVLRVMSRGDKALYFGWSMIAAGAVTALVWNSLLVDRRDAYVLGTAPITSGQIIKAKLKALGLYVGAIVLTMHTLASLTWGVSLSLGWHTYLTYFIQNISGHFAASVLASATTLLTVTAVQGLGMAVLGPRWFARISSVLQGLLTLLVGLAVVAMPTITTRAVDVLEQPSVAPDAWILNTPPMWFLGVDEMIIGRTDRVFQALAGRALTAFAVVLVITLVTHSLSYYRVMRSAIDQPSLRRPRRGRWIRAIALVLTGDPRVGAVAEFVLFTWSRVERHRLAIALGVGAAIAYAYPVAASWPAIIESATPTASLLTLPISLMVIVLCAMRVSLALPSDVNAAWIFDVHKPAAWETRALMERLFLLLGVAPFLVFFFPIFWWLWGARIAWMHTGFAALIGVFVVQVMLQRIPGVPCTRAWSPDRTQWRVRWPAFFIAFFWLASGMKVSPVEGSELELGFFAIPSFTAFFVIVVGGLTIVLRRRAKQLIFWEPDQPDPLDVVGTLNLS